MHFIAELSRICPIYLLEAILLLSFRQEVLVMNKDQVKGATKQGVGKVQEQAGKLVGSHEQQAKGIQKQAEGNVQKNYGDAKENVSDALKKDHH
jgi:uncharacterized protein YjbJ (UPF0337 family)